ncbi:hypothetical protein [Bradyrhizobium sp. RDM4]|uniref:hypothetical protein n=1 Tax=Bradyrhizobium sp. RDM4 TaxID=3378765 RepID=UPI0038FC1D5D
MDGRQRKVVQTVALEERVASLAAKLKKQAAQLPAGAEREALLRKARLADIGAHLTDWLTSPGLQTPD